MKTASSGCRLRRCPDYTRRERSDLNGRIASDTRLPERANESLDRPRQNVEAVTTVHDSRERNLSILFRGLVARPFDEAIRILDT